VANATKPHEEQKEQNFQPIRTPSVAEVTPTWTQRCSSFKTFSTATRFQFFNQLISQVCEKQIWD